MMRGRDGEVTAAQSGSRPQPRDLFRPVSVFSDVFRLCQALRFRSCPALFDDIADLAVGRLVEAVFLFIKHTGEQHKEERYDGHHQQQTGFLSASDLADHRVDGGVSMGS